MASLIDIRRRLRSVKNTQQITKAMKMVAAARPRGGPGRGVAAGAPRRRRAQDRAIAARPSPRIRREVLASVSARVRDLNHPLLAEREEKRVAVLVVSGDRGLAGAFNSNVNRAVLQLLAEKSWESVTLLPIGKKAVEFSRRRRAKLAEKSYSGIFSKIEYGTAQEIAAGLSAEFGEGRIDAAYVGFNEFKSVISPTGRVEW